MRKTRLESERSRHCAIVDAMEDRVNAVCDLLMGAAFADNELHEAERETVETHLATLMPDGELGAELSKRIASFDANDFDVASVAASFSEDSKEDRMALLEIVASVHAADDEYDFAEDEYLMAAAGALGLTEDDVGGHALDYEVEHLKDSMAKLRPSPPPIPNR